MSRVLTRHLLVALGATAMLAPVAKAQGLDPRFGRLPPGCSMERSEAVTGEQLALRRPAGTAAVYRFSPEPVRTETQGPARVVYTFDRPPAVFGVPCVIFTGEIRCAAGGLTPESRVTGASLLSATPHWPVDDPEVTALTRQITAGQNTAAAKVQAILGWLTPGTNITSEGRAGSRWGVKKVLKQKFGHCWDSSDRFVTLTRAAGIPARQVGGWLFGADGHIWAEVLLEGQGWQQVDPTGGDRLPCGIYHIPWFTTETGEMPILYLSMPKVGIVGTE